jgi:D-Tyr-tRNAtyr deacylase
MTMQRRHFELIAETIKDYSPSFSDAMDKRDRKMVAEHFAKALRTTNPQFNEARFLRACGVE